MKKVYHFPKMNHLEIPGALVNSLNQSERQKFPRDDECPCREKSFYYRGSFEFWYISFTPFNFFVFDSESQNKVSTVKMLQDLMLEHQKILTVLKLARPFDKKIDFGVGSHRIQFSIFVEKLRIYIKCKGNQGNLGIYEIHAF